MAKRGQSDEAPEAEATEEGPEAGGSEDDGGASATSEGGAKMPPANEITAPSIGPHTVIEKESPQERLASGKASDVDAMGLDKRRSVIGGRYSASLGKQAALYGIVLAVVAAATFGFVLLANDLDKAPASYPDKAPWTNSDEPPAPLQ